ncbi:MAG: hypothetical protein ACM3SW_00420, partial [Actinomycetota bacterium]
SKRAKTAKSSSDEPPTAGFGLIFAASAGFPSASHYPMTISDEMQQRLCMRFKKSDEPPVSISKAKVVNDSLV